MFENVHTIKFAIRESCVESVVLQTRFPKRKTKRIMKKWFKKYQKTITIPINGMSLVGANWESGIVFGVVHPEYYEKEFRATTEKFNADPKLPNFELVEA